MTVTVIRMAIRCAYDDQGEQYAQYCIVNTEMTEKGFNAYCQIYNAFETTKSLGPYAKIIVKEFPAHLIRDSKWSDEAGAIKQFERWQTADDVYTTDNPTID